MTTDSISKENVDTAKQKQSDTYPEESAAAHGFIACLVCGELNQASHNEGIATIHCDFCNEPISARKRNAIQRTLGLVFAALVFYLPANLYPIMHTNLLGNDQASTILGGVWVFIQEGAFFVAFVIFFASVVIPLAKIAALFYLCFQAMKARTKNNGTLTKLYKVAEFFGKWSMIDIFVVSLLVALVQITGIMSIEPGIASQAFALVVILTMLAAQQFDPRYLWDKEKNE